MRSKKSNKKSKKYDEIEKISSSWLDYRPNWLSIEDELEMVKAINESPVNIN